jgi:protein gp37
MAERTLIKWADSSLNWWEGCTKVSDGCKNCYAEARDKRFTGGKLWGKGAPRRKSKSAVKSALAMNRKPWICDKCGVASHENICWGKCESNKPVPITFHRRRIFSLSLGDWLDDEVPIEWLAEMLDTIRQCDQVTWILCTKRPQNFRNQMIAVMKWIENSDCPAKMDETHLWILDWMTGERIPTNIILLASVENQAMADKRIPELLKIPAACHGLSLEPLLASVNVGPYILSDRDKAGFDNQFLEPLGGFNNKKITWCIEGGESGSNARPCNVEWIRAIVQDCEEYCCACFVKQLGSKPVCDCSVAVESFSANCCQHFPNPIRDKKGGDISEWPKDLRIQQWPKEIRFTATTP